jgi:hypothetical protein
MWFNKYFFVFIFLERCFCPFFVRAAAVWCMWGGNYSYRLQWIIYDDMQSPLFGINCLMRMNLLWVVLVGKM